MRPPIHRWEASPWRVQTFATRTWVRRGKCKAPEGFAECCAHLVSEPVPPALQPVPLRLKPPASARLHPMFVCCSTVLLQQQLCAWAHPGRPLGPARHAPRAPRPPHRAQLPAQHRLGRAEERVWHCRLRQAVRPCRLVPGRHARLQMWLHRGAATHRAMMDGGEGAGCLLHASTHAGAPPCMPMRDSWLGCCPRRMAGTGRPAKSHTRPFASTSATATASASTASASATPAGLGRTARTAWRTPR